MAIWSDISQWAGNTVNNGGKRYVTKGLVLHIAEGSYTGTIAWSKNPSANVSYHFVIAKDGRCAQTLDTDLVAWTQANGNSSWMSVEFEGRTGDSLTPQMIEAAAQLFARIHKVYGVPLQLTNTPNMSGLGHHSMGGPDWGQHPLCPGQPIINQKQLILNRAIAIAGGNAASFAPGISSLLKGSKMFFVRLTNKPEVFLSNGMESVWLNAATLADLKTLAAEGRIDIPKTDVRQVGNRGVLGVIKGSLPPGYSANPI